MPAGLKTNRHHHRATPYVSKVGGPGRLQPCRSAPGSPNGPWLRDYYLTVVRTEDGQLISPIRKWLADLGLETYAEQFDENEVALEDLPGLTADDLRNELGIKKLADRRKLLAAISAMEPDLGEVEQRIIGTYPILIARPFRDLVRQTDIVRKSRIFVDVLTNTLKYLALVVETEYLRSELRDEALNRMIDKDLGRPLVSAWHRFLETALPFMASQGHASFIPELQPFYEKVELKTARRDKVKPPGAYYDDLGEVVEKKGQALPWVSALINYRNRLAHDANPPDEELQSAYDFYYPILRRLLEEMGWCADYRLYKRERSRLFSLMGDSPVVVNEQLPEEALSTNLALAARGSDHFLPLIPFFIVPSDHFAVGTEELDVLVYDQKSGKRIIYVSPCGSKRETTRTIDEWRKLVAAKQIIEPLLDKSSLTATEIEVRCARLSARTREALQRCGKVIEGLYYPRREAEPHLRAWPGSSYPLLAAVSPAGGGKTNLLLHMAEEWADAGHTVLHLSGGQMEEDDIISAMKASLRLEPCLTPAEIVSAATADNRHFIVIVDGINEHPRRAELLRSVIALGRSLRDNRLFGVAVAFRDDEAAWLKVSDSDRETLFYDPSEERPDQRQRYRNLPRLLRVSPLSHPERQGMWQEYVLRDKPRFKPQFTYRKVYQRNRDLAALLQNPLVLRLFLEVYAGRTMPTALSREDVFRAYLDRLGELTRDDGELLLNLGRVLLGTCQGTVELDLLYDDPRTKDAVRNTGIGSPYTRLIESGVLNERREAEARRVGFVVEAVLENVLGQVLVTDGLADTPDGLATALQSHASFSSVAGACRSALTEMTKKRGPEYLRSFVAVEGEQIPQIGGTVLGQLLFVGENVAEGVKILSPSPTEQTIRSALIAAEYLEGQLKSEQACQLLIDLVSIMRGGMNHNALFAEVLGKAGELLITLSNYTGALECVKESVAVFLSVYGENHERVANGYDSLGLVYQMLGNYDLAQQHYEKCLAIELNLFGEDHPGVARSYNNIGLVLQMAGEITQALAYHEKALASRLIVRGKQHLEVATSYNNIGLVKAAMGDQGKALECYERCLAIQLNILGEEHPHIAISYNNIGCAYFFRDPPPDGAQKALEYYEKGLAIQLKVLGYEHLDVARSYESIGFVSPFAGDRDRTIELYEKALAIELKVFGKKHRRVAVLQKVIAGLKNS